MATTATAPERKVSAAEAREVAEAAREQEWVAPSFVRDLFLGKVRLDLIHPYPEQDPEEVRRAQPFLEKLERLLREQVDSDRIDREGEIPESVIQGLRDLGAWDQDPARIRRAGSLAAVVHEGHRAGLLDRRLGHRASLGTSVDRGAPTVEAVRHRRPEEAISAAPRQRRDLGVRADGARRRLGPRRD